jgi:hypothetical protein
MVRSVSLAANAEIWGKSMSLPLLVSQKAEHARSGEAVWCPKPMLAGETKQAHRVIYTRRENRREIPEPWNLKRFRGEFTDKGEVLAGQQWAE